MIYLDTHVLLWLYAGLKDKFSSQSIKLINENALLISPMVKLELQYLFEFERINVRPQKILEALEREIGIRIENADMAPVLEQAILLSWTRDPFDRIIVAQAMIQNDILLTKDKVILKNYDKSVW